MRHLYFSLIMAAGLTACGPSETTEAPMAEKEVSTLQADYPTKLQKIADGVWVHTSAYRFPGGDTVPSNGLLVEDEDGLILVDTAWGEMATASLLENIKEQTGKDVTKLVVTHHHYDRLAGVDILERKGVEVISHPTTARLSADKGMPMPDTSVSALATAPARTKFGAVEVAYPGTGHTEDNLIVYVPAAKVLFGGGLVRGADQTSLGNIKDADLEAWQKSLGWMKATYKDAKLVVPGHGKGGNLSLLDATYGLIKSKLADTEKPTTED